MTPLSESMAAVAEEVEVALEGLPVEGPVLDIGGGNFQPGWRSALVREGTAGDTLSWSVHSAAGRKR